MVVNQYGQIFSRTAYETRKYPYMYVAQPPGLGDSE